MITLMIEVVRTSETPVYLNGTTWPYILEGCHLHAYRRENLKYQLLARGSDVKIWGSI
jgi:hypothetical protein